MTPSEADSTLASYTAALDAEIALLRALRDLATGQQAAMAASDAEALRASVAPRDRVMAALLEAAAPLEPLRSLLRREADLVRTRPGFAAGESRRRLADSLVREILGRDRETLAAARAANLARTEQARALDAGHATLVAYRRSLDTSSPTAVVVSQRA